ncbi:hypothetical protein Tco_1244680 [Tanacetum coccineum]
MHPPFPSMSSSILHLSSAISGFFGVFGVKGGVLAFEEGYEYKNPDLMMIQNIRREILRVDILDLEYDVLKSFQDLKLEF